MKPFDKGKLEFKRGLTKSQKGYWMLPVNPYKEFGKNREWQRGYDTAYFENLEKISNVV